MGRVKDVLIQFAELFSHPSEREGFLDALSTGNLRGPSVEEPITFTDVYDCWVDTHTIPQNLTLEAIRQIIEEEGDTIEYAAPGGYGNFHWKTD